MLQSMIIKLESLTSYIFVCVYRINHHYIDNRLE